MRLLSNIIKSTKVNISDDNCFSIDVPELYKKKPESINLEISEIEEVKKEEKTDENIQEFLERSKAEAEEIIKEANQNAENIIKDALLQAQKEIEQTRNQAEQEGYQQGYDKGILEVDKLKKQANEQLMQAKQQREELINALEPQMIDMVLKISENIFGKALKFNPQVISCLIKKGLSQSSSKDALVIHISVGDYSAAQEGLKDFKDFVGEGVEVELFRDTSLNLGDCIIETSFGNIDCSFETQFEEIKKEILYILENR